MQDYPQVTHINPKIMASTLYLIHFIPRRDNGVINIGEIFTMNEFKYRIASGKLAPVVHMKPEDLALHKEKIKVSFFNYATGIIIYRSRFRRL